MLVARFHILHDTIAIHCDITNKRQFYFASPTIQHKSYFSPSSNSSTSSPPYIQGSSTLLSGDDRPCRQPTHSPSIPQTNLDERGLHHSHPPPSAHST